MSKESVWDYPRPPRAEPTTKRSGWSLPERSLPIRIVPFG